LKTEAERLKAMEPNMSLQTGSELALPALKIR
jgi:hypothetical protein